MESAKNRIPACLAEAFGEGGSDFPKGNCIEGRGLGVAQGL